MEYEINIVDLTTDPSLSIDKTPSKDLYRDCFNNPVGKEVLRRLKKIANATEVDAKRPDPNAAMYKVAQLALVQHIENLLTKQGVNLDE